ncbi:ABC transporter permease [Haloimpatiens sp. FM7330]|uniref:ABC transporter permease n=1 Tax=Haloimpatiens sp. FM7330 TaxID=3298610 RepID=UPI00363757BB
MYGFIIVISLIGSLNIINTISTNMILRKREFSTLKAIGMTMGQINKMVLFEGIQYGLTGSICGLGIGLPLAYFLYTKVTSLMEFGWQIPWGDVTIAVIGSITIGLLSSLIPLRRIRKSSIIDDIRMEE